MTRWVKCNDCLCNPTFSCVVENVVTQENMRKHRLFAHSWHADVQLCRMFCKIWKEREISRSFRLINTWKLIRCIQESCMEFPLRNDGTDDCPQDDLISAWHQ